MNNKFQMGFGVCDDSSPAKGEQTKKKTSTDNCLLDTSGVIAIILHQVSDDHCLPFASNIIWCKL